MQKHYFQLSLNLRQNGRLHNPGEALASDQPVTLIAQVTPLDKQEFDKQRKQPHDANVAFFYVEAQAGQKLPGIRVMQFTSGADVTPLSEPYTPDSNSEKTVLFTATPSSTADKIWTEVQIHQADDTLCHANIEAGLVRQPVIRQANSRA